ncbi:MAG: TolC family protein, partial [Planctomycetes bacterium]|nr:TolC family protein [Planctomycetota bacterium]
MRFRQSTLSGLLALACCVAAGCPNLTSNVRQTSTTSHDERPPVNAARDEVGALPGARKIVQLTSEAAPHSRRDSAIPRRLPPPEAGDREPVQLATLEEMVTVPNSVAWQEPIHSTATSPPDYAGSHVGLRPQTVEQALNPEATSEPQPFEPMIEELDLTSALALAGGQSPQIAHAAARYREAYARLAAAQILWLPSQRVGVSYNHHDGRLQASPGEVIEASRSSFQGGLGAGAVGAGPPLIPGIVARFHTADAIYQPRIASHGLCARQAATSAATNDALLATALAYLELLRSTQELRIAEETRDNAQKLAELTATFASTGQGPQADADRAQTELVFRRNDVSRGEEAVAVASARLAEQLSMDGTVRILPLETTIVPIDLVTPDLPLADLVATGLSGRPELAEAQHLVCEAVQRYQRERCAPLVPSVLLGLSQSGF